MDVNDLMEMVHESYPNEQTRCCWDPVGRQVCPGSGDTLAEFIVGEIVDTYDAMATDRAQIADAVLAMNRAQSDLDAVAKALERRLERYRREDARKGGIGDA